MNDRPWHIITCEYPPTVGGVSDYVAGLAASLACNGTPVHVWCPATAGKPTALDGVTVHPTLGAFAPADCVRTGRELDRFSDRRLLVQWVPHGYGWKSLNVPFAAWLTSRALRHGDDLQLMVHEPFMRETWPPTYVAMSLVQRTMLWLLGRAASHVWLSTEAWRPFVSPYVHRGTPVDWLPIPAPVEPEAPLAPPSTRTGGVDRARTVGHFSTFSPVVIRHLEPALVQVLERAPDATALLIGRDSDRFCRSFVAAHPQYSPRVRATGTLSADRVAAQLLACDVMLMPFPDGVTARNTSLLSSLACGRPVVTNGGPLTEPFWRSDNAVLLAESPEAHALATLVITALDRPSVRHDLGARAAAFYKRRCSRRAAIDTLMPASASAPGASASLDHVRRSQTAAAAKTV